MSFHQNYFVPRLIIAYHKTTLNIRRANATASNSDLARDYPSARDRSIDHPTMAANNNLSGMIEQLNGDRPDSVVVNYSDAGSVHCHGACFNRKVSHWSRDGISYRILHKSRRLERNDAVQDRTERILMLNKVIMRAIRQVRTTGGCLPPSHPSQPPPPSFTPRARIPKTAGHRIGRDSTRQPSNRRSEILMRLKAVENRWHGAHAPVVDGGISPPRWCAVPFDENEYKYVYAWQVFL